MKNRFLALISFIFAMASAGSIPASNFSTNGYRIVQAKGEKGLCVKAMSPTQGSPFLEKVLQGWRARRDYKDESLVRLEKFELGLPQEQTIWFSLLKNDVPEASIRFYDGLVRTEGSDSHPMSPLPMERKFPDAHLRDHLGKAVIELGLLDVKQSIDGGLEALLHHVAKHVKDLNDFAHIKIALTAREANARLYERRLGFSVAMSKSGGPVRTPDGMYVMSMDASYFVNRFFGRRLYPVERGNRDEWKEFHEEQLERIRLTREWADRTYKSVSSLQGDGSWILQTAALIDPSFPISGWHLNWMQRLDNARELLAAEDIKGLDKILADVAHEIYQREPIQVGVSTMQSSVGFGPFRMNRVIEFPRYELRFRTPFGFNLK